MNPRPIVVALGALVLLACGKLAVGLAGPAADAVPIEAGAGVGDAGASSDVESSADADAAPPVDAGGDAAEAAPPLAGHARIRVANLAAFEGAFGFCHGPEGHPLTPAGGAL